MVAVYPYVCRIDAGLPRVLPLWAKADPTNLVSEALMSEGVQKVRCLDSNGELMICAAVQPDLSGRTSGAYKDTRSTTRLATILARPSEEAQERPVLAMVLCSVLTTGLFLVAYRAPLAQQSVVDATNCPITA